MDPRQRRTRERLHAAIVQLATAQPVSELSVTTVAAAAGVHRSTFYQHATSPAALLEQALLVELDTLRSGLSSVEATDATQAVSEVTVGVLRHIEQHLEIYRRGLGAGSGEASLHAMLSRHFQESGQLLLEQPGVVIDVPVRGVTRTAVDEAATRFIADGTVGLLQGWVQEPDPNVGDFMRLYTALLPTWWPGSQPSDGR